MLAKRLIVVIVLVPIGVGLVGVGGIPFLLFMTVLLGLAAWEYSGLMQRADHRPAGWLVVAGTCLLVLGRGLWGWQHTDAILTTLVLAAMAWHLVHYERGRAQAASDFAITLGGLLYIGWLGGYFLSLRNLPDGKWWFLTALPAVWIADAFAFFIGSRFGRHKLAPRLSPRKSWEGYLAGIAGGVVGGVGFAALWRIAFSGLELWQGAVLGLVMGVLPTLGDLGESMIKRQVGMKDSSNLLPGHGGMLDRIDSWLWAAPLGYYIVLWFFL